MTPIFRLFRGLALTWPAACFLLLGVLGGCGGADLSQRGQAGTGTALDDYDYLLGLNLIRGHLRVGVQLYHEGHVENALKHMKHPADELYADLVPEFSARGVRGFAPELEALGTAVRGGEPSGRVELAHCRLLRAIQNSALGANSDAALRIQVTAGLVEVAAEEYEEAIEDGHIVEPHEYQDAYGFVGVARKNLELLAATLNPALRDRVRHMQGHLEKLRPAWPRLIAPPHPALSVDDFVEIANAVAAAAEGDG